MRNVFLDLNSKRHCRKFVCILAFCWIFSISIGVAVAASFRQIPMSLMRMIIADRVSIVGLVAVLFLPFALSIVAVHGSKQWIIFAISVCKGVCFGFSIYFLLISYFNAAWLIASLAMFSANASQIPLYFFWIRSMNCNNSCWKWNAFVCFLLLILIGCLDYFVISPLLITIL